MDGVRLLGVSREVPTQVRAIPNVLGLTIGNMVCDLYERAEYLGLTPDVSTLKVEVRDDNVRVEDHPQTFMIRAEIQGETL